MHVRTFCLLLAVVLHTCSAIPSFGNPCRTSSEFAFCKPSLPVDQRVDDLLKRLTLADKKGLLVNSASGVATMGISPYQWWNEALHGVAKSPGVSFSTSSVSSATMFPQVILTAASFNVSLFNQVGSVISTEARAMYNEGQAHLTYWTPNINVFRDPRWGRGQETPGEDPKLVSVYAEAFVKGFQESDTAPGKLKASACCKHYWGYDMEQTFVSREEYDAIISKQDAAETYLPPFEACVKKANVSSVMCSYNAVNGIPACADTEMLTGTLRESWGFDGYITSDCNAVSDVFARHHFTGNPGQTVAAVLDAGMDLDCGNFVKAHFDEAIQGGYVTEEMVDKSLRNLLRVMVRLGLFDSANDDPFSSLGAADIRTEDNVKLALEAAQQSIVLLKNNNNTLPLNPKLPVVSVVGPLANDPVVQQGNYHGPALPVTVLAGIERRVPGSTIVLNAPGTHNVLDKSTALFRDAALKASASNVTVIVVGTDLSVEAEAKDRTTIVLPGSQESLVMATARAAKAHRPSKVVLVLVSGGSLDVAFARDSDLIDSIIWMGFAGEAAGTALANVLFGDVNPSGRLTQTFYPRNFVNEVSMLDMQMRPSKQRNTPGRGHRFYTGKPVYAFGDGLSYTKFEKELVQVEHVGVPSLASVGESVYTVSHVDVVNALDGVSTTSALVVRSVVRNVGSHIGEHVVLVFAHPPREVQEETMLKRKLVAFARTGALHPSGPSESVILTIDLTEFSTVDSNGNKRVSAGEWTLRMDDEPNPIATIRVQDRAVYLADEA